MITSLITISDMLLWGLLINTLLFGFMTFTSEKGQRIFFTREYIPNFLFNNYFVIISSWCYWLSFLLIIFSSGNIWANITIAVLMQFLINHIIWSIPIGIISGIIMKKKNFKLEKNILINK